MILAALLVAALAFVAYALGAHSPTRRERNAELPGDRLIAAPMYSVTQAITIDAPTSHVWPWIAQMGAGRAGWYSYDFIDNGGTPSANRILEEYQSIASGDLLPAVPGATDGFIVAAVQTQRDLVLGGPPDTTRGARATWEFRLERLGTARTRLIVRARVASHWLSASAPRDPTKPQLLIGRVYGLMARMPAPVLLAFAGFGHRLMTNRQLSGLKRRAEHALATPAPRERSWKWRFYQRWGLGPAATVFSIRRWRITPSLMRLSSWSWPSA